MTPPFTVEQFLAVFARYNLAVWPMQVVFYGLAVLLIAMAIRSSPGSSRWIGVGLAFFWAWMGIVYHWGYFAAINPAAYLFGGLFVLQAIVFLVTAVFRDRFGFRFRADRYGLVGAALVAYALIVYPLLGAWGGHAYPQGPTLGLPCPTVIMTFGFLLWSDRRVPLPVLVIPAVWSLLGFSAAVQFTIIEDFGLVAAGIVGTVLIVLRDRSTRVVTTASVAEHHRV